MLNSNIGARIKQLRERKGWTQEQLAEASGLHRVTIARYETTENGMTLDSASRLAKALGVTVDALNTRGGANDESAPEVLQYKGHHDHAEH